VETLTSARVERVQTSIEGNDAPVEWDSPLLSKATTPVAMQELALQLSRAERALAEIARDVRVIAQEVRQLAGLTFGEQPAPPPPVPSPMPPPVPEPDDDVPEAD
jgi:outer membrane protein TolC